MSLDINVREGGEQKRHNERMAVEHRKIELHEQDIELWKKDIELREGDHKLNAWRAWRECWLFIFTIVSLLISGASIYIAAQALRIASLQ